MFGRGQLESPEFGKLVAGSAVNELGETYGWRSYNSTKEKKLALICPRGMTNFRQKLQGSIFGVKNRKNLPTNGAVKT